MLISELQQGGRVEGALMVRGADVRRRQDGSELLRLTLGDRTGSLPAIVEVDIPSVRELALPGSVVWVTGKVERHPRFGPEILVEAVRTAAANEYEHTELIDGPTRSAEQMETD